MILNKIKKSNIYKNQASEGEVQIISLLNHLRLNGFDGIFHPNQSLVIPRLTAVGIPDAVLVNPTLLNIHYGVAIEIDLTSPGNGEVYKNLTDQYASLGIKLFVFNSHHMRNWEAKQQWIEDLLNFIGNERNRTNFLNRSQRRYGSVSRARKSFAKALQNQKSISLDGIIPREVKAVA